MGVASHMSIQTSNRLVTVILLGAFLVVLPLWVNATPQVLMISGTSTSGKSTTITHFLKKHPKWAVEGWDLALTREQENIAKNQFTDNEETRAYLDTVIAESVVSALQSGKSIVLDLGTLK